MNCSDDGTRASDILPSLAGCRNQQWGCQVQSLWQPNCLNAVIAETVAASCAAVGSAAQQAAEAAAGENAMQDELMLQPSSAASGTASSATHDTTIQPQIK